MPEQAGLSSTDALRDRPPTSHEQMSGLPWDASYQQGPAPWDIGGPQPEIARLASEGKLSGALLDAGCGSGENALYINSLGLQVLGVEVAETALALARVKARERGLTAEFAAADACELGRLGRKFQTVIDSGLFHTFNADERMKYAASLASVTQRDATVYVLCFSDNGPDTGPHPISRKQLREAFSATDAWEVVSIEPARIETRYHDHGASAWLATIRRMESSAG